MYIYICNIHVLDQAVQPKPVDDHELTGITAQAQTFEIRTCRGWGNHRSKRKTRRWHNERWAKSLRILQGSSSYLIEHLQRPLIYSFTTTTTLGPYCWFPKVFALDLCHTRSFSATWASSSWCRESRSMKGLTGIGCPVPLNRFAHQDSNFRYEPSFISNMSVRVCVCVCVYVCVCWVNGLYMRSLYAYAIHMLMI